MRLRQLRTFLSVATTLNFTKSAERLHLAQSSVTEQIQALEADLGTALFVRAQRRLALTAAGRRLVDYAKEILALTDKARAAVTAAANLISGELAVGGLDTLCVEWLPAVLSGYRTDCPDVQVLLRSGNSAELRRGLTEGTLDLCFSFGSTLAGAELSSLTVGDEPLVVILRPDHRLAGRAALAPQHLLAEPFLVTQSGCVYRKMFEEAFAETRPQRPAVVAELASVSAICGMVQAGLGCAIVPRLAASRAVAAGALAAVPWMGDPPAVPIRMSWNRHQSARPALKRFIDRARETFLDLRSDVDLRPRAAPCRS